MPVLDMPVLDIKQFFPAETEGFRLAVPKWPFRVLHAAPPCELSRRSDALQ
jgi:hypothetical protein